MANDPGISRKLVWFFGLFMVLLAGLTTVNLVLLLDSREADRAVVVEEEVEPQMPIFVQVGPMTVNLRADRLGQRYLYAGLSLRVRDEESREQINTHMPEVHSRLLVLLSDLSAAELEKTGAKQSLTEKILSIFEEPLAEGWPQPEVDAVLFTDFIVQ